jgi:hypothetical protein
MLVRTDKPALGSRVFQSSSPREILECIKPLKALLTTAKFADLVRNPLFKAAVSAVRPSHVTPWRSASSARTMMWAWRSLAAPRSPTL